MDTVKIHTTTDKMRDCASTCIYVVVDNTLGDMRNVAYCTTRNIAREMREMYCENTLGIDNEGEDSAIFSSRNIALIVFLILIIVFI